MNTYPTVVKLHPPLLNHSTILEKVCGIRPMRKDRFKIAAKEVQSKSGEKRVIHCYGHGGSGWTTLWGSVRTAIRLFEKESPNKNTPIRVIGSGCMGVTTAIELKRKGYNVAGISTSQLYDIASWQAGGYFALVSLETCSLELENLRKIGTETLSSYQLIEKGLHPYISKETIRLLPVYCHQDTDAGVEYFESKGLLPPREEVILDFGNGVSHVDFFQYRTYFLDTTKIMRQLLDEARRLCIPIEIKTIRTFGDVQEPFIFNCSGLGGKKLNHDDKMVPVRGHILFLNEKSGTQHLDYMIYTKIPDSGDYTYLFPKSTALSLDHEEEISCYGAIGGSFIPHIEGLSLNELQELDRQEFQKILKRNSNFFYGRN